MPLEVEVHKHLGSQSGSPPPAPPPPDKLAVLLTSFSHLRSTNRALVQTLQGSIQELRQLRSHLQKQHTITSPSAVSPEPDLAEAFSLTPREVQVARLLAQGRSNVAIAKELKISAHTARHHTQRVLSKLEVHSRGEAAAKVRDWQLDQRR